MFGIRQRVLATFVAAMGTAILAAGPVAAQGSYLSTGDLGYSGTLSCYASLSDALARSGSTCSDALPQRDLTVYFIDNNPAFAGSPTFPASSALFLTNWYASATDPGDGNPNNTNVGFMQVYDDGAGSVSSMTMGWEDPSRTIFHLAASGGPTIPGCGSIPPDDCGRLWDGGTSANGGIYDDWSIDLTLGGLTPAVFNPVTGVFESSSGPTSVTGTISGVFTDGTTGDFYAVDATINQTSWAVENGLGDGTVVGSNVSPTPEPATLGLLATGLIALGGLIRRRKRSFVV